MVNFFQPAMLVFRGGILTSHENCLCTFGSSPRQVTFTTRIITILVGQSLLTFTPRKINMEPENTPLEEENHLPNTHFQVLC